MTKVLRHRCRNPHCGTKLSAPVENEHHAFCTRGCFNRFYFNRCRVCEKDLRKTGKGDAHRLYCRPPNRCSAEARKWPGKYEYGLRDVPRKKGLRSARKMGLKNGHAEHPYPLHCLREWWWGGDGEHDHSLYDKNGLTLCRIVFAGGRYRLRGPIAIPHQSGTSLDAAKRGSRDDRKGASYYSLNEARGRQVNCAKKMVASCTLRLNDIKHLAQSS